MTIEKSGKLVGAIIVVCIVAVIVAITARLIMWIL